jgi:hypothetical protein
MTLDLTNGDFLLGVLASSDAELVVEWVATGSENHVGGSVSYEWRLISTTELDVHVLVLVNSEGGIEWKGELPGITKHQITEGLIGPFRGGAMGGMEALALLLTSDGASVNKRWLSKRLITRAISEELRHLPETFDKNKWAKRIGLK